MINKKTVKSLLQKTFEEPISSSKYIAFRKEHLEFPSYLQLKKLYGSWDNLCLAIWGTGARNRKWTQKDAKETILKAFPHLLTSTQYITLRSSKGCFLPTYEVLIELFGSWPEATKEIWGEKRELFRDWNQSDKIKEEILQFFNEPISSTVYAKKRKQQQLDLPSLETLLRRFQTWDAVCYWLWDTSKVEWTKELIQEAILSEYPSRISSTTYDVYQKEKPHLPIRSTIARFYGSWKEFSRSAWGEEKELTDEEVLSRIKDLFPTQPNQKVYEQIASQHPELLSVHRLEKRFGSWNTVIGIVYQGKTIGEVQPIRKYNEYKTSQLIRLVQRRFQTRPSMADYEEFSRKDSRLPSKSTLVLRFGDWATAMDNCFPNSTPPSHANNWDKEQITSHLKQALIDLERLDKITKNDYSDWRLKQKFPTPSVGIIAKYFGSFHEGLRVAGYSVEQHTFPSKIRTKDAEGINYWLNCYFEQLEDRPSTQSYKDFQKIKPEAPTIDYLVRFYETSWKGVVEQFTTEWEIRTHQIYSGKDIIQALKFAYKIIGIPMTTDRYDELRKTCEKKIPTSGSISRRFKTWRNALETAEIPYMDHAHNSHYQLNKVIDYQKEKGLNTLEDLLNWVLDDC